MRLIRTERRSSAEETCDPIREDVEEQVHEFIERVRDTFDLDRYPRVADGIGFDSQLLRVEEELMRLRSVFHDFLLASWADEIGASVREAARRAR
jgi:hypothetical protein